MNAKHQPAPWSRDKYGNLVDAKGESVLFRSVSTLSSGTDDRIAMAEANTDLAAAAPELLEALEAANTQMRIAYECVEAGRYDEALLHLGSMPRQRAEALAKARGES